MPDSEGRWKDVGFEMLSRIPPPRRFLPLLLGVFLVGATIGVLGTKLLRHSRSLAPARTHVSSHRRPGVTARTSSSRPVPHHDQLISPAARARFVALAARLPGRVGLAVAPLGTGAVQSLGDIARAHAWSTSKVLVVVTLLRDVRRRGRRLTSQEELDATRALEQSDNTAVEALFGELERTHGGLDPATAALQAVLRASGDNATLVNAAPNSQGFTTYGQTEWSVGGEVTFYRALAEGCLLSRAGTGYVLRLMRSVVGYQRWGAGSAGYPSRIPLAFKGGWGPSHGRYQVRQTAIIGTPAHGYVISLLALPDTGAFDDGVAMVTRLARWARRTLPIQPAAQRYRCPGR